MSENVFKIFCIETLSVMNIATKCIHLHTNQVKFTVKFTGMQILKFQNIYKINVTFLNLRPITTQKGTGTFKPAQFISNYLKSLYTRNK